MVSRIDYVRPRNMLSQLLKQARHRLGYGQRTMAKAVGVTQPTWARYETGQHWPSWQVVTRVKQLLKADPETPLADILNLATEP